MSAPRVSLASASVSSDVISLILDEGWSVSVPALVCELQRLRTSLVEIKGTEPLSQPGVTFLAILLRAVGKEVVVHTSGTRQPSDTLMDAVDQFVLTDPARAFPSVIGRLAEAGKLNGQGVSR